MNQKYDIKKISNELNLSDDNLLCYGNDKAKIVIDENIKLLPKKGKLILCTAITPTKAGEGKTTTAIGLADGLKAIGEKSMVCLREPSLGPVFGVKGGGAGGGEATLYPEDDINLHFTGDMHAISTVNNLIAAMVDNEVYQNSSLNIDPDKIIFPRCMDMNDRALRDIQTSLNDKKCAPHHSGFVITAASEIMACFCLATSLEDFLDRVEQITVAYDKEGNSVIVKQLEIRAAIEKLIKTALYPNLVQTKYHTPAIVHGGPFANIAHGTNSIIATNLSLKLADYVVTESGFGSDLGMEKYMDIVSQLASFHPNIVVLVCSIRALKLHGGVKFEDLKNENISAVKIGLANLRHHIENVKAFNEKCVVAINRFESDSIDEIKVVEDFLNSLSVPYALNSSYIEGPKGAIELAKIVKEELDKDDGGYKPLVDSSMTSKEKIETIAKSMYGCKDVEFENGTLEELENYDKKGYQNFSICISKTPNSLSDDPHLLNEPKDTTLHVKKLRLFTGARFIVPLTGDVFTMPGLPKVPAGKNMK